MNGTAAATAGGAAMAAMIQAVKASGAIVRVEPRDFETLIARSKAPLVVRSETYFFGTRYHYLTSYKGLAFYTKASMHLALPADAEIVDARRIWIPG